MRSGAFLCLVLVSCGGDGSSGDDAVSADANLTDGPPAGTPLDQRLGVTTTTTPEGVMAGRFAWRIWGQGDLRIAPVYTVPDGCETLVGYTTGNPHARVARIDAAGALVTTYDLGAFELRGLAVEPDGHFAALLWDATQDPAELHVQRFDSAGAPGWSTDLIDALAAPTDFGIGESRLEYGNGQYGAYFHVHGISGFADGHEGDQLKWLDAGSGAMSNGWSWGCSHSMSELLRYDAGANAVLAACVTDCFPGTSGSNFGTDSIGGVYLENSRKVLDVDGGCNGSVAGELGGAAPSGAGWKLVWTSHQAAAAHGQGSYSASTMNQDVGFASIGADKTPGAVVWLTTTTGNEANATIAKWIDDQYVVGWSSAGTYQLARVSAAGAILEGPLTITAKWGERDDPFRSRPNGDVTWAWFDAPGATTLNLARLGAGDACTE